MLYYMCGMFNHRDSWSRILAAHKNTCPTPNTPNGPCCSVTKNNNKNVYTIVNN